MGLRFARPDLRGDEVTSNAGGTNVGKARRDAPLTSCLPDFRGINDMVSTVVSVLDCDTCITRIASLDVWKRSPLICNGQTFERSRVNRPGKGGYSNNFYGNHILASHTYMHIRISEKKTPKRAYLQSSHD